MAIPYVKNPQPSELAAALNRVIGQVNAGTVPTTAFAPPNRIRFISGLSWQMASANLAGATTFSNGTTQLSGTEQWRITPPFPCRNPQLLFANGYSSSASSAFFLGATTPGPISYNCAWDFRGFQLYPMPPAYPNGTGNQSTIYPQTMQITQPFQVYLPGGTAQKFRVYKSIPSTNQWPNTFGQVAGFYNADASVLNSSDFVYGGAIKTGADYTATYAFASVAASPFYGWGPMVVGELLSPSTVGIVIGDSISYGFNSGSLGLGYLRLGINNAGGLAVNAGMSGIAFYQLANAPYVGGSPIAIAQQVQTLVQYADYVACHCGINDLKNASSTLANLIASVQQFIAQYSAPQRPVFLGTILPTTTSAGNWAGPSDQVPVLSAPVEAVRIAYNNILRDPLLGPATFNPYGNYGGFFDPCTVIEVNADGSGLRLPDGQQIAGTGGRIVTNGSANGYTPDGLHLNAAGAALAATAVPAENWSSLSQILAL